MSSPYYPPTGYPPPERRSRACWLWGCGVLLLIILAGLALCGGCVYLARRVTEKPVAAADAWFRAAQSEDWAAAGALTQGGESRARTLGAELTGRVGNIQAFHVSVLGQFSVNYTNGAGEARLTYSVRGDRGSTSCAVLLEGPPDDWRVSDLRFDGQDPLPEERGGAPPGSF